MPPKPQRKIRNESSAPKDSGGLSQPLSDADYALLDRMITRFRGLPSRLTSGPRPRERSMLDIMSRCIDKLGIEEPRIEEQLFKHWTYLVGPDLAHRCSPKEILRGDLLVISASNPTIRSELAFRKSSILLRVKERLGNDPIKGIVVR